MAWQSLEIRADAHSAGALSDALLELGAASVSIEDAEAGTGKEAPIFAEPGEAEEQLWQHSTVAALFPEDADSAGIVAQAAAAAHLDPVPPYRVKAVAEQDWVRLTQAQFEPIRITPALWIVPSWHAPPDPAAVNLVLDPGLAFGTGSHPTTRLCLQWLADHVRGGESVLDYGCGSGILAIAALKLGAARALGVDIDPQAVQAAEQNARRNGVPAQFSLPEAMPHEAADVVVANILANPLKLLAPLLAEKTRPGGHIVLSGILLEQADGVKEIYQAWFDMQEARSEEGWVCLTGVKR